MRDWLASEALTITAFVSLLTAPVARARMPLPTALPPQDGKTLFVNQCATCHTLDPAEPVRQGPLLRGVVGRPAGSVPGFHYSPGFANAKFIWDPQHLDAWLTRPQAVIPGAIMPYAQLNPEVRGKIIGYLREQH